jgi:hypothetical protein
VTEGREVRQPATYLATRRGLLELTLSHECIRDSEGLYDDVAPRDTASAAFAYCASIAPPIPGAL